MSLRHPVDKSEQAIVCAYEWSVCVKGGKTAHEKRESELKPSCVVLGHDL